MTCFAAEHQRSTLLPANFYVVGNRLQLSCVDHRAHGRRGIQWVARHPAFALLNHHLHEFFPNAVFDNQARSGCARLATVVEHGDRSKQGRLLQIRVRENNVGALATELQERPFEIRFARITHQLLANLGRAGECQAVDVVVQ